MIFTQSEGTAARRRFPIYLVDATDGITPETGESGGQPQISKAGGAFANTTATLTDLGNGAYYVELTAAELNTLGTIQVRYKSANTAEFNAPGVVVAYNQHDAVRLGLTALPNAAANAAGGLPISTAGGLDLDTLLARLDASVSSRAAASALATAQADLDTITGADGVTLATLQGLYAPSKAGDAMALTSGERTTLVAAVWNALTSGMTTAGSIGKKLADWVIHSAADVWAVATRVLTAGTNISLAKGTGVTGFNDISSADAQAAAAAALGATDSIAAASLSAAGCNKIADHVLRRTQANVEASANGDAYSGRSLTGAVAKLVNKVSIAGTVLTVTRSDDATTLFTQNLTTDAAALPIIGADTA